MSVCLSSFFPPFSVKDKAEKTFAYSFLKVLNDDGSILQDGDHYLNAFKVIKYDSVRAKHTYLCQSKCISIMHVCMHTCVTSIVHVAPLHVYIHCTCLYPSYMICVYIHRTCIHVHMFTYIVHVYLHHTYVHMFTCLHTLYMFTSIIHMCMFTCLHTFLFTSVIFQQAENKIICTCLRVYIHCTCLHPSFSNRLRTRSGPKGPTTCNRSHLPSCPLPLLKPYQSLFPLTCIQWALPPLHVPVESLWFCRHSPAQLS